MALKKHLIFFLSVLMLSQLGYSFVFQPRFSDYVINKLAKAKLNKTDIEISYDVINHSIVPELHFGLSIVINKEGIVLLTASIPTKKNKPIKKILHKEENLTFFGTNLVSKTDSKKTLLTLSLLSSTFNDITALFQHLKIAHKNKHPIEIHKEEKTEEKDEFIITANPKWIFSHYYLTRIKDLIPSDKQQKVITAYVFSEKDKKDTTNQSSAWIDKENFAFLGLFLNPTEHPALHSIQYRNYGELSEFKYPSYIDLSQNGKPLYTMTLKEANVIHFNYTQLSSFLKKGSQIPIFNLSNFEETDKHLYNFLELF